jgi:DNA polymerase-3 subunit epsilon
LSWDHGHTQEQVMATAGDDPSRDPGSDGSSPSGWEQTDLLALVSAMELQAPAPIPTPEAAPEAAPEPVSLPEPEAVGLQRLLILDTETTGLDPEQHHCIEVGAILFDVPHRAVLSQVSFLLPCQANPAEAVNGIAAAVTQRPQPWQAALQCFEAMLAAADAVLAHNAAFDRQWFGQGVLPAITKPWLCSMEDLRWPADRQLRANPSVRDLALAYGVPVWAAHRALTDCIYLAQVFERCPELEPLLQAGLEPRQLYRARVSYDERHKAREAGFRWNEPIHGAWSRRLSEREASLLPFPVVAVEDQRRTA